MRHATRALCALMAVSPLFRAAVLHAADGGSPGETPLQERKPNEIYSETKAKPASLTVKEQTVSLTTQLD